MGIQPASARMDFDFHFTCFTWLNVTGVFASPDFGFTELIAAGTREGAIVLFGVNSSSINRVALLCSHKFEVTDIKQTSDQRAFLSIAQDSSICGWSNADGSCSFVLSGNNFISGDFRLCLCPWNSQHVWTWSIGGCATLIDLQSGTKIATLSEHGLMSFTAMSPRDSSLVKAKLVVCVTSNKLVTYNVAVSDDNLKTEIVCELPFFETFGFQALEKGILKYSEQSWVIISPYSIEIAHGKLIGADSSDNIAFAQWSEKHVLVLGTFSGVFNVVRLKMGETEKDILSIDRVDVWKAHYFVSKAAFSDENGIAFGGRGRCLCVLNDDQIVSETVRRPRTNSIYSASQNCYSVLQCSGPRTIEEVNLLDNTVIHRWSFDRDVTAIKTRMDTKSLQGERQLVVGFADGSVCFCADEDDEPVYVWTLPSPVVEIVFPPFRLNGSIATLFIGQRGQCSLFRFKEQQAIFGTPGFSLKTIHYTKGREILVLGYSHGVFEQYHLDSKLSLGFGMTPPQGSDEIWSCMPRLVLSDNPLDTVVFHFASSYMFFQVLHVSEIYCHQERDELKELLKKYFEREVLHSDQSCDSFVLFGYDNIPTFFFPPYRVNGDIIYSASPNIAAAHYLLSELLCEHFNIEDTEWRISKCGDNISYMLPIFVQMAFSDNETVKNMAAKTCVRHMNNMSLAICQELAAPMSLIDTSCLSDQDKMMLALMGCAHSNIIPAQFWESLYTFLMEQSSSRSTIACLALCILLRGIDKWVLDKPIEPLFCTIMKRITLQKRSSFFDDVVSEVWSQKHELFVQSFANLASMVYNECGVIHLRDFMNMYSSIVENGSPVLGSLITLEVAKFGERCNTIPELVELADEFIRIQAVMLPSVEVDTGTYVIGDNSGTLTVYNKGRRLFAENLFQSPILLVSIGPDKKRAIALSGTSAKVVSLSQRLGFVRRSRVEEKVPLPLTMIDSAEVRYSVSWKDSSHYSLKPVIMNL